jgi:hypothetical protein
VSFHTLILVLGRVRTVRASNTHGHDLDVSDLHLTVLFVGQKQPPGEYDARGRDGFKIVDIEGVVDGDAGAEFARVEETTGVGCGSAVGRTNVGGETGPGRDYT